MKVENPHFSYGSHEVLKGISFGVDVEVCSMHRDDVRVCIPAHLTKGEPL